jgi:hypothetical protein
MPYFLTLFQKSQITVQIKNKKTDTMPRIKSTEAPSGGGKLQKKMRPKKQKQTTTTRPSSDLASPAIVVEGLTEDNPQMANDTNMLVFTKKDVKDEPTANAQPLPKRLSRKERIRLEKIVEKKEKTNKVGSNPTTCLLDMIH